jgi:hypothetical protein
MRAMNRFLVLFSACLASIPALASSQSGDFLICASEDNLIKMTADLSTGRGEKTAVAVFNGRRILLDEVSGGKARHRFMFYPDRRTPLMVGRSGVKTPEIRVSVDPARSGYAVVLDRKSPVLYRVAKYNAKLTVKSLGIESREVACTESKWASD